MALLSKRKSGIISHGTLKITSYSTSGFFLFESESQVAQANVTHHVAVADLELLVLLPSPRLHTWLHLSIRGSLTMTKKTYFT